MGSSNADDDASATISDATSETDTDDAVESLPPFGQGDKVLAYHSRRIYEAKVLEVDPTKERFFVHYQGWSKNWDEWVGMDRLMIFNKENLEKQKALEKEHPLGKSGRAFHLKPKNPNVTRGKKRKRLFKGTSSYEKLVDIQIPPPLKKHLVNYCEYITHMGKLVKLPCIPNVDEIFKLYLEQQSNKDGRAPVEIINGLQCYFDKALPVMLLYKGERKQYEEATANGVSPSKVYGAEHLLRLFVKLPEILYHANIEEETLTDLQHKLQDFLKFLQKKQSLFFVSTYETPNSSCKVE
ncbi:protein MRG2-like [Bidens hawaiensis]|uniref:protein MRG2-like n=1 Tax=Bidens hawaiensis TaxID=980011 RepID=UPI00404A4159